MIDARRTGCGRCRAADGFTLVELLVVMSLIVILVALVGGAGIAVVRSRQESVTTNLLLTMDRALDEYISVTGSIPQYRPELWENVPGLGYKRTDSADFRPYPPGSSQGHPVRPDASVFIRQAQGAGEVDAIIGAISERFLVVTPNLASGNVDPNDINDDFTPSVIDYWGEDNWIPDSDKNAWAINRQQLIYYVHPDNLLAQELYGQCVNRRPYFLSAGRDLKYGLNSEFGRAGMKEDVEAALEDNLHSYEVGPPNLTDDFWGTQRSAL